jgi:hypothetical protein
MDKDDDDDRDEHAREADRLKTIQRAVDQMLRVRRAPWGLGSTGGNSSSGSSDISLAEPRDLSLRTVNGLSRR